MHVTHHHIQKLFKIKSELQEVYWNLFLETLAKSLIGIFVPIYLLILGYTLPQVLTFLLFYLTTLFISSPLAASIAHRVGLKHLILYRIPLFILFYVLLLFMQFFPFSLAGVYITGIIGGLSASLYWIPLNTEFAKNTKKIHEGEEIAKATALKRLATIFTPTIAALILITIGFTPLFGIVIFLAFLSVFPLFASTDYKGKFTFSQEKKLFFQNKKLSLRLALRGPVMISEAFLWPLFIFVTLESILDVGIAVSIGGLGIAFFIFLIGRLSDKVNKRNLMKVGGLAYGLVWFSRIFASTPLEIFLLSLLGGMFAAILEITVFSSFCDVARGRKVMDWVVVREVWLGIGRVSLILLLLLAAGMEFTLGFTLAGIASLLFLLL